jgi:hemerythrin-like metal-binding protein
MQRAPSILMTGHRQIDSQHLELEQLIQQLGTICEAKNKSGSSCDECSSEYSASCTNRLEGVLGDLLGFVVTHFFYEEKLMRQLSATKACRQHVEDHKLAHAEISSQLADLARSLDGGNPKQRAFRLQQTIGTWMGAHMCNLDIQLADALEGVIDTELAYDIKLAELLAQQPG